MSLKQKENICEKLKCRTGPPIEYTWKNNKLYCAESCNSQDLCLCCYSCRRKECKERYVKYHKISIHKLQTLLIFERFEQAP